MALEVAYWKMEDKSDIEIKRIRIARKAEIEYNRLIESRPADTDVVTLERSDNQSPNFHILWSHPNYRHLDERF